MNEQLVESVAQSILTMSDEERQLLEELVCRASPENTTSTEAVLAAHRVNVEENGHTDKTSGQTHAENGTAAGNLHKPNDVEPSSASTDDEPPMTNAFLRTALSLKLQGPADWSANVDHYLYGLPKQND